MPLMKNPQLSEVTKSLSDFMPRIRVRLESRGERPEMPVVFSKGLNSILWGIQKKKLYVIAGRTSQGKSAMCCQMAHDLIKQGKRVLFCTLEMDIDTVGERMFSLERNINNTELIKGAFGKSPEIKIQYNEFANAEHHKNLLITEYGKTPAQLKTLIDNIPGKIDVLIIDHLHHIKKSEKVKLEIEQFILHLCDEMKKRDFAVVVAAQLNRMALNDEAEPDISHLKESGFIEEAADVVALIYWPFKSGHLSKKPTSLTEEEFKKLIIVKVDKNRGGFCGRTYMKYEGEFYKFSDWPASLKDEDFRKKRRMEKPTNLNWQDGKE